MSFTPIAKRAVGKSATKTQQDLIIDATSDLDTRLVVIEGEGVTNGSFEIDDDADGNPDTWTVTQTNVSESWALTTTQADVYHGKQAFSATLTTTLNDAVQITSDNRVFCAPGQRIAIPLYIKNASGIKVTVTVYWWYWTGSAWAAATTASTVAYTGSETLASYAKRLKTVVPQGTTNAAEAYTIEVEIGGAGETTAGTVYIDGLESYLYRGIVPITRTSKTSGTVTLTLHDSNEHPIAGWFTVRLKPSDSGTYTLSASGTDQFTGNSITVYSESGAAASQDDRQLHIRVPVDTSNQCTITVDDGGGASGVEELYQVGYEV